jgi:hypothetical protein
MGIALGRGEDYMFQTDVSWVDVDSAISMKSCIYVFKVIGGPFNIREDGDRNEAFESYEVTKKRLSHLLGVIIGIIKGKPFADSVGLAKG